MHRFRKRSDAKNSLPPLQTQPLTITVKETSYSQESQLPELPSALPSADDFRTSLILPDLSRRFSLLRDSSGDPISLEILRSRLADQRARGAENHILEEDEEMILETLGLRPRTPQSPAERSQENLSSSEGVASMRQSIRSSNTASSLSPSLSSSPSGRSKRYSNNLFGSGRLRDYSYNRMRAQSKKDTSSVATVESQTLSISQNSSLFQEGTVTPSRSSGTPPTSQEEPSAEYQMSKSVASSVFKRASLALEEAIRELEEDAEDEIVMPRSAPITRTSLDQHHTAGRVTPRDSANYEAGTAITSDPARSEELEASRMSPILSRVSPGYVPGMPRPMTPRDDSEHDNLRSHSTTPRATPSSAPDPQAIASTLPRHSPRPHSPYTSSAFLNRKMSVQNGNAERNKEADIVSTASGSSYNWHNRPSSPLSSQPHQPMSVPQRPNTPSNVTWTVPPSKAPVSPQKSPSHNRNGSWFSDSGAGSTDTHGSYENGKSSRSLRSPALPDSPLIGHSTMPSFSSTYSSNADNRPISPITGLDLNQTFSALSTSRVIRSPTPTQAPSRSPTSPTFSSFDVSTSKHGSRRSSKQNSTSSPFSLTAFNPVVFHPIASSSRSSLDSLGSSYHSGEGDQKDRLAAFVDIDAQQQPWHDVSFPSQSSSATTGSPDMDWNAEEIVRRYAGLNKSDIAVVQEKLVGFATEKAVMESENRERAPSLRKRRPSTSQSNYSYNGRDARITSPPPQNPNTNTLSPEQMSKASAAALLKSVVESIQMPPAGPTSSQAEPGPNDSFLPDFADDSPTVRRNRDLAQILFGDENADIRPGGSEANANTNPNTNNTTADILSSSQADSDLNFILDSENKQSQSQSSPPMPSDPHASPATPYTPTGNPSNPHLPRNLESDTELAREVQRKAEAAMQALKKPSKEGLASSPSLPRKRINPHQISTPTLVSASTSVDTIPLRTPTISQQTSRLGSRFKKLRGTLRKNPSTPSGEEVTPYPLDIRSAPLQPQTVQYDQRKLHPIEGIPNSATELGRFNIPVAPIPSPPASAGPGLKGFMARFRGKPRATESPIEQREMHLRPPIRTEKPTHHSPPASAPAIYEDYSSKISGPPILQLPHLSPSTPSEGPASAPGATDESAALRQLFDAASNLGLDQQKLNDLLLVRSASTSSKLNDWATLTRSNSSRADQREATHAQTEPLTPSGDEVGSRSRPVSRRPSTRQQGEGSRKPRERTTDPASVVVRRTLILPSDPRALAHLSTLVPSVPNKRHRRASGASIASRNVPDRMPTPPPRSPTGRRFSTDTPPPVPPVPRPENYLAVPTASHEKAGSAYDSFYEMYGDENKGSTSDHNPRTTLAPDATAVEVIELANGETIWQIVNGLRDDDESIYTGRTSFASEYDNDESMHVYVKEHTRTGSKGSGSSFFSRKKSIHKNRPETRVYYSSANQIGLLIDNISQGMDAGSFNIMPDYGTTAGQSTTSSLSETDMHHWTVEERLERMLGRLQRGES